MTKQHKLKSKKSNSIEAIWERYNKICHLCDKEVPLHLATRDHIDRELKSNGNYNLALAHRKCNYKRGPMTVEEFRAILKLPEMERRVVIKSTHRQYTKTR